MLCLNSKFTLKKVGELLLLNLAEVLVLKEILLLEGLVKLQVLRVQLGNPAIFEGLWMIEGLSSLVMLRRSMSRLSSPRLYTRMFEGMSHTSSLS